MMPDSDIEKLVQSGGDYYESDAERLEKIVDKINELIDIVNQLMEHTHNHGEMSGNTSGPYLLG
jgi:hypothetical protein